MSLFTLKVAHYLYKVKLGCIGCNIHGSLVAVHAWCVVHGLVTEWCWWSCAVMMWFLHCQLYSKLHDLRGWFYRVIIHSLFFVLSFLSEGVTSSFLLPFSLFTPFIPVSFLIYTTFLVSFIVFFSFLPLYNDYL